MSQIKHYEEQEIKQFPKQFSDYVSTSRGIILNYKAALVTRAPPVKFFPVLGH